MKCRNCEIEEVGELYWTDGLCLSCRALIDPTPESWEIDKQAYDEKVDSHEFKGE